VSPVVIAASAVIGLAALAGFVAVERASPDPMVPLDLFRSRQFSAANLVTVAVYAALGGAFFLLAVDLQQALRYSPLAAGAALVPVTLLMLALSSTAGRLAQRVGPRLPMTVGPAIVAVGLVLMRGIDPGTRYLPHILAVVTVFGLGLALTVAPLTATVLAAADTRHAGVASGVNNAVARVASLLAVAVLPLLAGLTGDDYQRAAALSAGFHTAVTISAGLCLAGSVIAFLGIGARPDAGTAAPSGAGLQQVCCPVDAPPLRRPTAAPGPGRPSGPHC
jgi:predicted MFS family arabinose efflux permease